MEKDSINSTHSFHDLFPQKFHNVLFRLFDSFEFKEEDFYKELLDLKPSEKKEFVQKFEEAVLLGKIDLYYTYKYVETRPNTPHNFFGEEASLEEKVDYVQSSIGQLEELEYALFVHNNPRTARKFEEIENDVNYFDFFQPGNFPETDKWIRQQIMKMNDFVPRLEKVKKALTAPKHLDDLFDKPQTYSFPTDLMDDEDYGVDISEFRVKINDTLEGLIMKISKSSESFKNRFGEQKLIAFIYNTFSFSDNPTSPTTLNLNTNDEFFHKTVEKHIREIALEVKDQYDIDIIHFSWSLFLNYRYCRLLKPDSSLALRKKLLYRRIGRKTETPKK